MNSRVVDAQWHKSSYSNGQSACVEVANSVPGIVPVRDSKAPTRSHLAIRTGAWQAFVESLKIGGDI